ncbi:hypothetical protein KCP77_10190 [Salmonella enterica subsp. enterica]|nr:hypothetical protein KCP77_10190 [Salmonella enterica subsp. enterica]
MLFTGMRCCIDKSLTPMPPCWLIFFHQGRSLSRRNTVGDNRQSGRYLA